MTIDRIMNDYHLDKIDILKVDIEGADKEVFSNALSWIEKVEKSWKRSFGEVKIFSPR
jgi:FkbM family methyltransferase